MSEAGQQPEPAQVPNRPNFLQAAEQLRQLGQDLGYHGWLPATSGNLSIRLTDNPTTFAITRSGGDKRHLVDADLLRVDLNGHVLDETSYQPSAETAVHIELYRTIPCGCILHVHTMFNNLASQMYFAQGHVSLVDHELLKALGHWTEGARITVPIVGNFADLQQLAQAVRDAAKPEVPGVLVRNHGIYAWGETSFEARRHLEALEFLFEYDIRLRQLRGNVH